MTMVTGDKFFSGPRIRVIELMPCRPGIIVVADRRTVTPKRSRPLGASEPARGRAARDRAEWDPAIGGLARG